MAKGVYDWKCLWIILHELTFFCHLSFLKTFSIKARKKCNRWLFCDISNVNYIPNTFMITLLEVNRYEFYFKFYFWGWVEHFNVWLSQFHRLDY